MYRLYQWYSNTLPAIRFTLASNKLDELKLRIDGLGRWYEWVILDGHEVVAASDAAARAAWEHYSMPLVLSHGEPKD